MYEKHIKVLPVAEQLELLSLISAALATEHGTAPRRPKHRLTELRGLGKEIWEGVDPDEYVNRLRDEWDERTP